MNINGICNYETPCGWCSKWDKKCDNRAECGGWLTEEAADNISKIIEAFKSNQYICSICGKIISPYVTFSRDKVHMTVDKAEARGGLGERVLLDNVCEDCKDKIGL